VVESPPSVLREIARCLTEPRHLRDSLRRDLPGKRRGTLDPELARRVRLFAGLVTRVKHGFVWQVMPQTMRLLGLMHRELDVFATYYETGGAQRAVGTDRTAKTMDFSRCLAGLLRDDQQLKRSRELHALYRHEHIVWAISGAAHEARASLACVQTYPCDPRHGADRLMRSAARRKESGGRVRLLYTCAAGRRVRIARASPELVRELNTSRAAAQRPDRFQHVPLPRLVVRR
jgi:hypothetical protein